MSLYDRYVLPWVLHLSCSAPPVMKQREKVIPRAKGTVLEIGIGTGLNLPFYRPDQVECLYGLEPAESLSKRARTVAKRVDFPVHFLDVPGEAIPLADNSIDTVVLTFTLCTIADPMLALQEMLRVLKLKGSLLFCEHGLAPIRGIAMADATQSHVEGMRGGVTCIAIFLISSVRLVLPSPRYKPCTFPGSLNSLDTTIGEPLNLKFRQLPDARLFDPRPIP